MKFSILILIGLAASPAPAEPDPVAVCRATEIDPQTYVACLEAALRARGCHVNNGSGDAATTVPANDEPSGLGAEQVRDTAAQRGADPEQVAVRIVSANYNARGLGTYRTADGQVWRETTPSPERRRLEPDAEYTAHIRRGWLGGYRMHVDGIRHMKTVERIE